MSGEQQDLLAWTPPDPLPAGGSTYVPARDSCRLSKQAQRVYDVMKSGEWYTPAELEAATGDGWASLSARIRDWRKTEFNMHGTVEREYVRRGLFRYRLLVKGGDTT
jgi:hypothetical protein